jgi:Ca-activated chloride channel homolog
MLRFAHAYMLYAMLLIPVFLVLYLWLLHQKKSAVKKLGDPELIKRLMPFHSKGMSHVKFIIRMFALLLIIIALSGPQLGSKIENVKRKGVDIVLALDISNSMLAQDIKPCRIDRAKQAIYKLIDNLENDRIGLVVFAGKAFIQLPITFDYGAAKMFLSKVKTDLIAEQGTAIGAAIEKAASSFKNDKLKNNKAIIVISDGENHEDDAVEQARIAKENGIIVSTIGMGTLDQTPIPLMQNDMVVGYKKDADGNTVLTQLNEVMLQQIASAGGGIYVRATTTDAGIDKIVEQVGKMEKNEMESKVYSEYDDKFQYFIVFALLLLVIDVVMFERKHKWVSIFIPVWNKKVKL